MNNGTEQSINPRSDDIAFCDHLAVLCGGTIALGANVILSKEHLHIVCLWALNRGLGLVCMSLCALLVHNYFAPIARRRLSKMQDSMLYFLRAFGLVCFSVGFFLIVATLVSSVK